jgi:hypothetical protein
VPALLAVCVEVLDRAGRGVNACRRHGLQERVADGAVQSQPTDRLALGAVVAGIVWELVQILGTYFVTHALKGASEAYGVFGLVLGLAWVYLLTLVTVVAVEVNVVAQRHLWPRALLAPSPTRSSWPRPTSAPIRPTPRAGVQGVRVDFGVPQPSGGEERQDADEPGVLVR